MAWRICGTMAVIGSERPKVRTKRMVPLLLGAVDSMVVQLLAVFPSTHDTSRRIELVGCLTVDDSITHCP